MGEAHMQNGREIYGGTSGVVISGLGAVSSAGGSAGELWEAMLRAEHRPGPAPDDYGPGQPPNIYRIEEPAPSDARFPGRATGMALRAVGEALADAALDAASLPGAGLTVGTTLGDVDLAERGEDTLGRAGAGAGHAGDAYRVSAAIATRYGLFGPNQSLSTACSAGVYAVSWAAELIRDGQADVVVACGTDGYSRVALASLDRFGLLDREVCRPFDAGRLGMVTGDGAAAVVLESAGHARRRGASPYAVIEGAGWSCDGYHPTAPEPTGEQLSRAVTGALEEAGGTPGAAVLHRAGIAVNDVVESDVIARALGREVHRVPAYGIKAVIGHTAGAAGVFACVAGALMLRHGTVPPNAHVSELDPGCPLTVPLTGPVPLAEPRVLVSATGFGGNNAAVVMGALS